MKLVIFGPAYPFRGGIAQFSGVLAQSMLKAGHRVHLINFKKQFPRLLFPGKTQFDDSPQALRVESQRVFTLWNPFTWFGTARRIREIDPDLILFAWWMPFFGPGFWAVAKLLGAKYRARLGFLLHNVIPHERRFGDEFFSRLALDTGRFFIVLSRAEEKEMRRLFPRVPDKSIRYSPHPLYDCYDKFAGTRAEARARCGVQAEKLIMFFGFIREYKGLDVLVKAMPRIRADFPDLKLAVVGEFYQDRGVYDALIRELKLEDCVVIREGYISGAEVGQWFAASDCVILPYRSATQSGIVPIAYALETPVITTDVGGLGEVVEHGVTGLVVPPESPNALAMAVKVFYEAGGRPAFEENVKKAADSFSWDGMRKVIEDIEREISALNSRRLRRKTP